MENGYVLLLVCLIQLSQGFCQKPHKLQVDREKVLNWLQKGAQMTDTVECLLRKEGIVQEFNKEKESKRNSVKSKKPVESKESADSEKEAAEDSIKETK